VTTTFDDSSSLLDELRNPDGGFGVRAGQPSESEPTALGALALETTTRGLGSPGLRRMMGPSV